MTIELAERLLRRAGAERVPEILADVCKIMRGDVRRGIYVQRTHELTRMRRFYLSTRGSDPQVFLHELLGDDEGCVFHDHPWHYSSLILQGGYTEERPDGSEVTARAGDVLVRRAEHQHRIQRVAPESWTLMITSPVLRRWRVYQPRG